MSFACSNHFTSKSHRYAPNVQSKSHRSNIKGVIVNKAPVSLSMPLFIWENKKTHWSPGSKLGQYLSESVHQQEYFSETTDKQIKLRFQIFQKQRIFQEF